MLNLSFVDTCQSTMTSALGMPPWPSAFSGDGASRVHSTTLSGVGLAGGDAQPEGVGPRLAGHRSGRDLAGRHDRCPGDGQATEDEGASIDASHGMTDQGSYCSWWRSRARWIWRSALLASTELAFHSMADPLSVAIHSSWWRFSR